MLKVDFLKLMCYSVSAQYFENGDLKIWNIFPKSR